jgi:hypothetical protein
MLAPSGELLRAGPGLKLNQVKIATRSYLRDRTHQATDSVTSPARPPAPPRTAAQPWRADGRDGTAGSGLTKETPSKKHWHDESTLVLRLQC